MDATKYQQETAETAMKAQDMGMGQADLAQLTLALHLASSACAWLEVIRKAVFYGAEPDRSTVLAHYDTLQEAVSLVTEIPYSRIYPSSSPIEQLYSLAGILGEAGELATAVIEGEGDAEEEAGDVAYFLADFLRRTKTDFGAVLAQNKAKVKARHKEAFDLRYYEGE